MCYGLITRCDIVTVGKIFGGYMKTPIRKLGNDPFKVLKSILIEGEEWPKIVPQKKLASWQSVSLSASWINPARGSRKGVPVLQGPLRQGHWMRRVNYGIAIEEWFFKVHEILNVFFGGGEGTEIHEIPEIPEIPIFFRPGSFRANKGSKRSYAITAFQKKQGASTIFENMDLFIWKCHVSDRNRDTRK